LEHNKRLPIVGLIWYGIGNLILGGNSCKGIRFAYADKLLNSAIYRKGISFVRADKLLNSAIYRKGISFVRADKLLNSAITFRGV